MLNYLWAGMILLGVGWAAFHGRLDAVTMGILESAGDAVTLGITMLGILAFWSGIMEIGQRSGLVDWLAAKMDPIMGFLFPRLDKKSKAVKYMAVNMIANMLGLGSAATPAGLAAFKELEKLEDDRRRGKLPGPVRKKGIASNEMCTFLIINISSLQLIPVNVIAYRSQYGSVNPAAIVGPGIVATAVSTLVAVIFCKMMDGKRRI
jgi:spore maturation protein A